MFSQILKTAKNKQWGKKMPYRIEIDFNALEALQREVYRALRMVWNKERQGWGGFCLGSCLLNELKTELRIRGVGV